MNPQAAAAPSPDAGGDAGPQGDITSSTASQVDALEAFLLSEGLAAGFVKGIKNSGLLVRLVENGYDEYGLPVASEALLVVKPPGGPGVPPGTAHLLISALNPESPAKRQKAEEGADKGLPAAGPMDGQLLTDMMGAWAPPLVFDDMEASRLLTHVSSSIKLPLSQAVHQAFCEHLTADHTAKLKAVDSSRFVVSLMASLLQFGHVDCSGGEMGSTVTMGFMLGSLVQLLSGSGAVARMQLYENNTEKGTATKTIPRGRRPDHLIIAQSATLYVGEDKKYESLQAAFGQLQSYVKGGLSKFHYGNVKNIFGHAASEPFVQFCIITTTGEVQAFGNPCDISTLPGRIDAVRTITGIIRLIHLMVDQLPALEHRSQPLYKPFVRDQTTVTLNPTGAAKYIHDYKAFAESMHTSFDVLLAAYQHAANAAAQARQAGEAPFLVTAAPGGLPTLLDPSSRSKKQSYTVQTQPLGYFSHPSDELDVARLALACCKTAELLHKHGMVLRDFRLNNAVRLSPRSWMVIDLELCSMAPVTLPSAFSQVEWTEATCSPAAGAQQRLYTTESDMHQIGVMMHKLLVVVAPGCSEGAWAFVRKLKAKELSAEQALSEEWLRGLSA